MLPSMTVVDLRRAVSRHRSVLAAGLAAGSVAAALAVLAPHPAAGVLVLAARRDLAAGTSLTADDVRTVELPTGAAPAGALVTAGDVAGRVLAAPVRRGEAITDVRLAGTDLLARGSAGLVAVPVRVADAATAALVTAGDRVDVLAASTAGTTRSARVVAADAEVLAVPTGVQGDGDGALIVVAATPPVAADLAAAAVSSRLSLTLHPRA